MILRTTSKLNSFLNLQLPQYNYVKNITIAILYILSARLGLFFATTDGHITLIWPPSGIALAGLIIFGIRLWPGILIGAYIADIIATDNVITSIGMSIGSTGSAILGYWLVLKFIGKSNPLSSIKSLYIFVAIAIISPIIASNLGTTSLVLTNIIGWSSYNSVNFTWWIGDFSGILLFTPVIIAWQKNIRPPIIVKPNYIEITLFTILLILTSSLPYLSALPSEMIGYPLAFISFPFCIWAAYKYCMKQVTLTLLIIMILAVYGTATGQGPFYRDTLDESLFQLQTFMVIIVITTLSLASAVFERQKFEIQLLTQKKRAEELTRAKSQFMSSMSHELRTPLNAITGFSHILQQDQTALNNQQREFVGYISDAGNHLLHLVNDLLDIEQNDAKKLHIKPTRIKLYDAISESIHFIEQMANKRNISIHYDEETCQDFYVTADKTRLKQVLINLLSNAAKYNRENGSITITCEKNYLSFICIAITDTGEGISKKDIKTIFEPFSRIQIEDSYIEGSGIGLTVAHKLVALMNGNITVTSSLGEGSTFTIKLPIEG